MSLQKVQLYIGDTLENLKLNDDGVPYMKIYLGFAVGVYIFHTYLDARQLKAISKPKPPEALAEHFPQEKYDKIKDYSQDKWWFGLYRGMTSQVLNLIQLLYYTSPALWQLSGDLLIKCGMSEPGEVVTSVVFMLVTSLLGMVTSLPFDLYGQFVLEERHGFNKMTFKLYVSDMIKQIILSLIMGPPIIAAFSWILLHAGPLVPLYVYMFVLFMQLVFLTIYPTLIQPLFNKYEPLEEGELRQGIEKLASSLKFPLKMLFVVDGSKRSAHSNAYMYGFFGNKRIVLYDTLINQATKEQVVAVLAHELGHWKYGHTISNFIAGNFVMFVQLVMFMLVRGSGQLFREFGWVNQQPAIIAFVLYNMISAPVDEIVSLGFNAFSRRNEFQADNFAVQLGHGQDLRSGLLKLQEENKSSLHSDSLYSAYHYSHPPLIERLAAIDSSLKKTK